MESIEASSLIVIEAALLLGVFVNLLDHPTRMGQQDEAVQGGVFGQDAEPVFDLLFFRRLRRVLGGLRGSFDGFGYGTFGQQPAFGSGVNTAVAGTVQRGAGSPVDTQSHGLDLHRAFGSLAPTDGVPGGGGQGLDQRFDRVQRSRARLARLPTPALTRPVGGPRSHPAGHAPPNSSI